MHFLVLYNQHTIYVFYKDTSSNVPLPAGIQLEENVSDLNTAIFITIPFR